MLITLLVSDHGGAIEQYEYPSAIDAVTAAVELQRAGPRQIGLHVGEVVSETAAVASALAARAQVGQILASPLVRDLVTPRRGHTFEAIDEDAAAVVWGQLTVPVLPGIPAALEASAASAFVARNDELSRITQAWKEAVGGERRAVFISGAAGMGKTRLAAEVARLAGAGDEGATILYGRCAEELGMPYHPFVEALNAYVRTDPDAVLGALSGAQTGDLARVIPALAHRVADLPQSERSDPAAERYLMFEAMVELLRSAGDERPVLLVLDDLHWATKPTVLLLRHLLRADPSSRLVIIGTYRDDELDRLNPLTDALAELRRLPGVERLALRGFDRDGVVAFLAAAAGHELDDRGLMLAAALHDETDGNPFYMAEVLNHLVESGVLYQENGEWTAGADVNIRLLGLPESVRDVVGRRLGRLSAASLRALTVAAVVGPVFDTALLQTIPDAGDDANAVLDALDEAEAAGLILPSDRSGYMFDHSLIRQTLLSGLTSARRARLHRRVGEAIEARPDADDRVDALAFHFGEAVGGADIGKAADYAVRAAERALAHLAHEEALAHVDRGLHALDLDGGRDPGREADLWLLRANALQDGPREDAGAVLDALAQAATSARASGSVERLVRTAELLAEETVFGAGTAPAVELCEEALDLVGKDRPELRARVLGALVYARATMESSTVELAALAADAVAASRAITDPATRSRALVGQGVVLLSSPDVDALHATGLELAEVTAAHPEAWVLNWAHRFVGQACLQRGDRAGFNAAHAELARLGRERRHTTAAGWSAAWDGMVAMLDGRIDDVERHTVAIVDEGGSHVNYTNAFTAQLFYLRREQGRLAEIEPVLTDAVAGNPGIVGFRVALAVTLADLEQTNAARRHFEVVAEDGFATVPRDLAWTGALGLLTDVCAALGDQPRAAVLSSLLAPYSGQLIVAATGVACPGAADRYLGVLAATQGRANDARQYYDSALELERRIGAPLLVARTEGLRS